MPALMADATADYFPNAPEKSPTDAQLMLCEASSDSQWGYNNGV